MKKSRLFTKSLYLAASLLATTTVVKAGPVDLTGWISQGGGSNWTVQSGNDAVFQSINGSPTVFFDPTATSTQGTALNGKIKVQTSADDDYIGFVLGYNSGEITSPTANFMLIDWKQGNQNGGSTFGYGYAGLAISHVSNAGDVSGFWGHDTATGSSVVSEVARATTLGSTGWSDNTEYDFNIVFTSNLIEVSVNGALELAITAADAGLGSFGDGAFGFYNYSQQSVLYSAIQQIDCQVTPNAPECVIVNVPEPGTISLFGAGLMYLVNRRRKLAIARS